MVLLGLLVAAPGCVAEYDEPGVAFASAGCPVVSPNDEIVVDEPCAYYRVVIVDGIPYRHYYAWEGGGWVYHGWVVWRGGVWAVGPGWRGPRWHGNVHEGWRGHETYHGGWHSGGVYHGGHGGHGGHR